MSDGDTDEDEPVAPATQCDDLSNLAATQEEITAADEPAAPAPIVYGRLLSEADSSVQLIIDDSASEFTIGRGNCSLRIDNARISSNHARITIVNNTVQIEDLSTNGVWLNGAKLGRGSGLHALSHLDELACSILGDQGAAARFIFAVPSERRQQMQQGPGLQASNPASRAGSPNAKRQKTDGAAASSQPLLTGVPRRARLGKLSSKDDV